MYSEVATVVGIIAMHDAGLDIESIARRIRTDRTSDGGNERRWYNLGVHAVGLIVGRYADMREEERHRADEPGRKGRG